jgi:hypothetical protein
MDDYLDSEITTTGLDLLQIAYGLDAASRNAGAASPVAIAVNLPQRTLTVTAILSIESPFGVSGPALAIRPSALLSVPLPTDPSYG